MKIEVKKIGWEKQGNDNYFAYFASEALRCLPQNPSILDVGCGSSLHPNYYPIREQASQFWGCDVDAGGASNESITRFVEDDFVTADLPVNSFDFVMATYVLEHLATPLDFFERARIVLREGGVFGFLTPNARHPFCFFSRLVENLHLKSFAHRAYSCGGDGRFRVNDYPAYYRANTIDNIVRFAREAGFKSAYLTLFATGWEYYFPYPLRFFARGYDRLISSHRKEGELILVGFLQS